MYFDAIRYEFMFDTDIWTDVSDYVIGTDKGQMGIRGWGPLDRVAGTGSFTFSLRNVNNMFTPRHINCMDGFETGVPFKLVLVLDGDNRTRFYGKIPADGIQVDTSDWHAVTTVTVVDYMEQLAIHELDLPEFAENKRIDEIVPLIIANMPIAPLSTDYNTGQDTFATVFDTTKTRTRALQEIAKVAASELGYVYIKQTALSDEVLVVEGRMTRTGLATPVITLDDCFIDHALSHAENYYNSVKVTAHPRRVDSAATTVLFELERVIPIAAGDTETIKVGFRDPNQEAVSVAGIDMVTPAATTDYLFNAADDGSGTDLTADLSVTATYGVNGVEYELENTGASLGYVTHLQARGKGVYTYRPVAYEEEYAAGIAADGKYILNLEMVYQDNPLVAKDFSGVLLDLYASKRLVVESVTMIANRDEALLEAFVTLHVGDLIRVLITSADIDAAYYVHSIEFSIAEHGIVLFTLGLFSASLAPSSDYWFIGEAGYSEIGETTVMGF